MKQLFLRNTDCIGYVSMLGERVNHRSKSSKLMARVSKRDSSYYTYPKGVDKEKVVSITYEEIGLFPRSFSRVLDRFLKQLFSDVDNLVIQEYRFYRYLFLTTIKTIFILFFVPFVVNFVAKNYVVKPVTEYFWNTQHPEIFLNSYEQKRAFAELEKFEEKIYFEALVQYNNYRFDIEGPISPFLPERSFIPSSNPPQGDRNVIPAGDLVKGLPFLLEEQRGLGDLRVGGLELIPLSPSLLTPSYTHPQGDRNLIPAGDLVKGEGGLGDLGEGGLRLGPSRTSNPPLVFTSSLSLPFLPKLIPSVFSAGERSEGPRGEAPALLGPPKPNSVRLEGDIGPSLRSNPLIPEGTEGEGVRKNEGVMRGISVGEANGQGNRLQTVGLLSAGGYSLTEQSSSVGKVGEPQPWVSKSPADLAPQKTYPPIELVDGQAKNIIVLSQVKSLGALPLTDSINEKQGWGGTSNLSLRHNTGIPYNLSKDVFKIYQEKTIELATYYNNHSIEAITNFFADLLSLCALLYLLVTLEIQINITKSFLAEVFFGLDDSKKSLLILLVTDLLVGYHSSNLWELFFQFIFNHYGIPESQTGIFLLVATLPVLLDVLFKYLIFRHLNRSSPATVATYQAIIE